MTATSLWISTPKSSCCCTISLLHATSCMPKLAIRLLILLAITILNFVVQRITSSLFSTLCSSFPTNLFWCVLNTVLGCRCAITFRQIHFQKIGCWFGSIRTNSCTLQIWSHVMFNAIVDHIYKLGSSKFTCIKNGKQSLWALWTQIVFLTVG